MSNFEHLFKPYQIGSVTIKNRFCLGPMAAMNQVNDRGDYTQNYVDYMVERARGGWGLLFTGATWTDLEVDGFQAGEHAMACPLYSPTKYTRIGVGLTERVHAYGAKIFPQITMGLGRNAVGESTPSELPLFWDPSVKTKALTNDGIKKKIEGMIKSAAIIKGAGFDGVEVHAMHWGYLLDQFAMSYMNYRTDEYGGSLENRMRCAKEIVQGIKQVCGSDFPVTMRLGLKTYLKGFNQASLTGEDEVGRTLEEGLEISKLLESYGYDALSVDVGVYDSFYYALPPMYVKKGYTLELAAAAKKVVKIPILTGGRMNDPYLSEEAIANGQTDAVVLSRAGLADPFFPKKTEMGQPEKIRPCIACNAGCLGHAFVGGDSSCAVNPTAMRDASYNLSKAIVPKKVAVVGGGVAGMEAARVAKLRGHNVTLFEKSDKLGGNLIPAGIHEFKNDVQKLNQWYEQELKSLNVPVCLGTAVTPEMLKEMKVDTAVLAVGSVPVMPNLPGIDNKKVSDSIETLLGKKKIGQKVVIVGGGLVGCEMAIEMAQEGKQVTVVEMLDSILMGGAPVPYFNSLMINDLLAHHKVEILTGCKLDSVNDTGAVISAKDGSKKTIEADSVVIAIGYKPVASFAGALNGSGIETYEVGDGHKVASIMMAVWDAYEVARGI